MHKRTTLTRRVIESWPLGAEKKRTGSAHSHGFQRDKRIGLVLNVQSGDRLLKPQSRNAGARIPIRIPGGTLGRAANPLHLVNDYPVRAQRNQNRYNRSQNPQNAPPSLLHPSTFPHLYSPLPASATMPLSTSNVMPFSVVTNTNRHNAPTPQKRPRSPSLSPRKTKTPGRTPLAEERPQKRRRTLHHVFPQAAHHLPSSPTSPVSPPSPSPVVYFPWNKTPPEIVRHIVSLVAESDRPRPRSRRVTIRDGDAMVNVWRHGFHLGWMNIARVDRRFRAIVYDMKHLWAQDALSIPHLEVVRAMVEHAGTMPLSFDIDGEAYQTDDAMKIIQEILPLYLERVGSINVYLVNDQLFELGEVLASHGPLARVTSLSVKGFNEGDPSDLVIHRDITAPSLLSCSMDDCRIGFCASALTELRLLRDECASYAPPFTMNELVALLKTTPALEKLWIRESIGPSSLPTADSVELPNLSVLTLHSSPSRCTEFLRHVILPNNVTTDITFRTGSRHDIPPDEDMGEEDALLFEPEDAVPQAVVEAYFSAALETLSLRPSSCNQQVPGRDNLSLFLSTSTGSLNVELYSLAPRATPQNALAADRTFVGNRNLVLRFAIDGWAGEACAVISVCRRLTEELQLKDSVRRLEVALDWDEEHAHMRWVELLSLWPCVGTLCSPSLPLLEKLREAIDPTA
ncbi:hypothetical protein OF83DRAFT_307060 [Amylostereum chailletii]|nr:hypothetical protein OF83DRAFT_307060 [Amylostereum chailletii]